MSTNSRSPYDTWLGVLAAILLLGSVADGDGWTDTVLPAVVLALLGRAPAVREIRNRRRDVRAAAPAGYRGGE